MKLFFLYLILLKPCGCWNKVCDLKKVVTCFLRYLIVCILASYSDLHEDVKGSGFSQEYSNTLLLKLLVWAD